MTSALLKQRQTSLSEKGGQDKTKIEPHENEDTIFQAAWGNVKR